MILTEVQRHLYVPPPCDRCGGKIEIDWVEVTNFTDMVAGFHRYMAGETRCLTPGCADEHGSRRVPLGRCRICRRPVGDVHTAECAPLVLAKAADPNPCRVQHSDCQP